ncbi:hypothetical protein P691DRAFT_429695 [Macrolepiota fuliginosa MF-IS2]|uniref:Uncharacterized protein n=1 Tax=Macrolepiota fuliginosa MF-IS2 TaxID=1400762 RepID=A0A9P5X224_9AGAR|nr:hypothetical protein P691DRAFT_429695 [Macrolepiota fuliginosa MF-IS2]
MPFLPEIRAGHTLPGPGLSTDNKQSFLEGVKRFFKGESKPKTAYSSATAQSPLQNVIQPSPSTSTTADARDSANPLPTMNKVTSAEHGENTTAFKIIVSLTINRYLRSTSPVPQYPGHWFKAGIWFGRGSGADR